MRNFYTCTSLHVFKIFFLLFVFCLCFLFFLRRLCVQKIYFVCAEDGGERTAPPQPKPLEPSSGEVFSPRRSSRGVVPNRRFQDMELDFGRKRSREESSGNAILLWLCRLHKNLFEKYNRIIIILMCSFMCCFSKLEHIIHYNKDKAKNHMHVPTHTQMHTYAH